MPKHIVTIEYAVVLPERLSEEWYCLGQEWFSEIETDEDEANDVGFFENLAKHGPDYIELELAHYVALCYQGGDHTDLVEDTNVAIKKMEA